MIPHTTTAIPQLSPPQWPVPASPGRFAHSIRLPVDDAGATVSASVAAAAIKASSPPAVALIGLPDDLGIRLNGGRIGAAEGPRAFREALARYGVAEPASWEWPVVIDVGDVIPAAGTDEAALHETHRRITETVRSLLEVADGRLLPIAIGGGHDLTFAFVRGVSEFWQARGTAVNGGIYFDAHLDVRETVGSGMPFRRLIEVCGIERLLVYGVDEMANSREHTEWFTAHGGKIEDGVYPKLGDSLDLVCGERAGLGRPKAAFLSFDLDVFDAAHAPGVSAMNPCGFVPWSINDMLEHAGADPRILSFDIMELCPKHDEQGRTARLAAQVFLRFLKGFSRRPPP